MPDDHSGEWLDQPQPPDEFEHLVLDENFVRGGAYEPPARTRDAIARFGSRQTSWRHGGGLGRSDPSQRPSKTARTALSSTWAERLPLIVTVAVVAVVVLLAYH